jgi:hypothetical protein
VVNLPTFAGDVVSLSAGNDLVVVSPLSVGSGTVTLTAGKGLTLGEPVTASVLTLTAGTAGQKDDVSIQTAVDNLVVDMKGTGNFTVVQSGDLNLGSLNMSGGNLTIVADGDVTINSLTGTIGSLSITSKTGNIKIINNTAMAGAVTLDAASGSIEVASIEADTLDITAKGNVSLVEKDDVVVNSLNLKRVLPMSTCRRRRLDHERQPERDQQCDHHPLRRKRRQWCPDSEPGPFCGERGYHLEGRVWYDPGRAG